MASRAPGRGWFITLEGPEGAGKSTQAAWLADALRKSGREVCLTREPGGNSIGERLRAIVLAARERPYSPRADALLFNAARAQLVDEVIRPALDRGAIVVCDRFSDSTLAYQGYGGGLDPSALRRLADWATGGLVPDLTILLDLPVDVGLGRRAAEAKTEESRFEDSRLHGRDFHERVRDAFLRLALDEPSRWRVVDADRPPPAIFEDAMAAVSSLMASGEPIARAGRINR